MAETLAEVGQVGQTQLRRDCSAAFSSGQFRAAHTWQLVAADSRIPSVHRPRFKRLRNRAGQPTSLARLLDDISLLPELGIAKERALHLGLAVLQHTHAAYDGVTAPRVTRAMVERDMELNLAENLASLRAEAEDTPEAHDAAADRIEAEVAAQMERARLHRLRAEHLRRGKA